MAMLCPIVVEIEVVTVMPSVAFTPATITLASTVALTFIETETVPVTSALNVSVALVALLL